ncbi:hypothetical protein DEO72_LG8g1589 [Vigna unguiculata]|uniref:Uncharacterized protein n=1 Tax=Vigna unguiculata TaxID=3917 RepID=A0A4D6MS01_VIGUN|nr:hypothetical protein DEO72_LG8g1589 [Vigna unguiculata]
MDKTQEHRGLRVRGVGRQGSSRQAITAKSVGSWSACAWRCGLSCQAATIVIDGFEALGDTHSPPSRPEAVAPGSMCPPPDDFATATLGCWVSTCVIYRAFSDVSKVGLLVFLELSSERIP